MLRSDGLYFCFCDEYADLLEIGTSIIAPLMVEYARFPEGILVPPLARADPRP